jgi:hypothetical protein
MEYYSAIKNNEMSFEGKRKELEPIMFREISQAQKPNIMFLLLCEI